MTRPLRSKLVRLTHGEAALLSRLAETLSATPAAREASGWITFVAEPAGWTAWIAPLSAAGAPLRLTADGGAPDALHAATAMEAVEPLIARIEQALGQSLRPVGVTGDAPTGPAVRVDNDAASLLLAFAADGPVRGFAPAAADPARVATLPAHVACVVRGPSLAPDALSGLAPGDMLLVPATAPAELVCGDMRRAGRADLVSKTLTIEHIGSRIVSSDTEAWTEARLPVDLVIDGGAVTVGRLAALAPGSVLELDAAGDVLPVLLRSGGVTIGRGELVAVGDGFGVILSEVSGARPAPPEPSSAPAEPATQPADA